MSRGELRHCPECRRPWPKGAEHDLRSFRWLDDLPRHVSPSNIDCVVHDGVDGRSRFLVLETKGPEESIEAGQGWLLRALAALAPERLAVRVLHGTMEQLTLHRVTRDAIEVDGTPTTPAKVRSAVAAWLGGSLWRDAESGIRQEAARRPVPVHACDWEHLEDGTFRCIHCAAVWGVA